MKLPIAIAALFLAATTALPASAAAPTGRSFYDHGARTWNTHHDQGPYSGSFGAYSASPRGAYAAAPRVVRPAAPGWGHCVGRSDASELYSAYPSWELCGG
jgi:hypothetical protein